MNRMIKKILKLLLIGLVTTIIRIIGQLAIPACWQKGRTQHSLSFRCAVRKGLSGCASDNPPTASSGNLTLQRFDTTDNGTSFCCLPAKKLLSTSSHIPQWAPQAKRLSLRFTSGSRIKNKVRKPNVRRNEMTSDLYRVGSGWNSLKVMNLTNHNRIFLSSFFRTEAVSLYDPQQYLSFPNFLIEQIIIVMFQLLRLIGDPAKLFLCLSILLMDKPVFTQKAASLGFADDIPVLTGKRRRQAFQGFFFQFSCQLHLDFLHR